MTYVTANVPDNIFIPHITEHEITAVVNSMYWMGYIVYQLYLNPTEPITLNLLRNLLINN